MSGEVIKLYKKKGETPLECLNRLENKERLPLTYAGRLDPLAQGVLLVLKGDERFKKDEYLALSKEYELTVLFGFETDTYDLLGKVILRESQISLNNSFDYISEIKKTLPKFTGEINQQYPPYSSKPVNGKSLFQWARENRLNEIEIPTHKVQVDIIEKVK